MVNLKLSLYRIVTFLAAPFYVLIGGSLDLVGGFVVELSHISIQGQIYYKTQANFVPSIGVYFILGSGVVCEVFDLPKGLYAWRLPGSTTL